jgi:hypothetical protein
VSETITQRDSVEHLCSECGFVFERGLTPMPCPACGTVDLKATTTQEAFGLVSLAIRNVGREMARTAAASIQASHIVDSLSYAMRYRMEAERRRYANATWYERLRFDLEADIFALRHFVEYNFARHITRHIFADIHRVKLWIANRRRGS